MTEVSLPDYQTALKAELRSILSWWTTYAVDDTRGGFHAALNNENGVLHGEPKGLVLHARILWTFSEACRLHPSAEDMAMASRAFNSLCTDFYDPLNGGFYWSVDADGDVLEGKKQIYGQAFAIYGLAAYYQVSKDPKALQLAQQTFTLIERHSFDVVNRGYIEALSRAWTKLDDLRLSEKDLNSEKSMNTHLHVIEAYARLFSIWPDHDLGKAIKQLLYVFRKYIISRSGHQHLFFSNTWMPQSALISYGHDIEAAWLLQESAEILGDQIEIAIFRKLAVKMANAVLAGLDTDGGMFYEYDKEQQHLLAEKHWWPQAEAMVGFFNAYQVSGDRMFLTHSFKSWTFVQNKLKDQVYGEWYWGTNPDGSLMDQPKAGFWKCPYHNARACLELIRRIGA